MGILKSNSGSGVIRSRSGSIVIIIILLIFAAFMLLPFIYAIVQAFKPMEEIFAYPPRFFVKSPTLDNFYLLTQLTNNLWIPFWRYVLNSLFVTIIGTVLSVFLSSLAAFPLAKYKFPGSKFLFEMIILSLLFVGPVLASPQYIIVAKLGLINTYGALIFPALASTLGLFLLKNFMSQINDSILDSARIDGAGILRMYWAIVMPLVKPAWLTLIILSFQGLWNGAGSNYIFNESLKLLPTVLGQIVSSGIARSGVGAAAGVLMIIPPFIAFIILQSNVMETMAYSGVKE